VEQIFGITELSTLLVLDESCIRKVKDKILCPLHVLY